MARFQPFRLSVVFGLFFLPISFVAFAASMADCAQLPRDLRLGMSGEDVRMLQVLLNRDVTTRVAISGDGAPGKETVYFGAKTRAAVIRFQNLYKGEVLLPSGLTSGSGFVGTYTRAHLLHLPGVECNPGLRILSTKEPAAGFATLRGDVVAGQKTNLSVVPSAGTTTPPPAAPSFMVPQVNRPSSYVVSPGDKVSVSGTGFSSTGNILHVGALMIPDLGESAPGTLEATIPLDTPKGKFDLSVSNTNGESNKSFLIVVERGAAPPAVKSFFPARGTHGTTVSVIGEGFTKENNEIYVGNKPVTGISSLDGKTLSFVLSLDIDGMSAVETRATSAATNTAPIWFYVVNANGISNNGIFTLTL